MSKKYGLFVKEEIEKSKKVKTFVDDLEDDSDDNTYNKSIKNTIKEDINKHIQKQQYYNQLKLSEEMSRNLLEDPNFYEYDSLYDDMTNKNKKTQPLTDTSNNPKYIMAILQATEKRKLEQSILKEKVEMKKRLRETGSDFADKPKFITKAYEEKIKMNQKLENSLNLIDKIEERNTVNSEMGMMGFYSNLLTKNVAYGGGRRGDGEDDIVKVYQEKKKQFDKLIDNNKIREKIVEENKIEEKIDEKIEQKIKIIDTNTIEEKKEISLEDYKSRYLERKRNRTEIEK